MEKGTVYLVGAGPGDPELITVKGKRLLEEAEVVIYDRLVGEEILSFINPEAEKLFVGKRAAFHTIPQDDINSLLVRKAREDKMVVRLKGGDPYIFGRGSEEVQVLSDEGIPFEVVPGITSASGLSAYAGIPLTDRKHSSAVTFVTGHKSAEESLADVNWSALADMDHTLVFYMAIKNISTITRRLVEEGKPPDTPSIVVRCATMKEQKEVAGPLSDIAELVEKSGLRPPALLVVGKVISRKTSHSWFNEERSNGHQKDNI